MIQMLRKVALATAFAIGLSSPSPLAASAFAQSAQSDAQLVEDFIFYVNTANLDMAAATANAILDKNIDPRRFVGIIEDSATLEERFERAYLRALFIPELEDRAAQLWRLYTAGRLSRARDPNEIARNISMLTAAPRAQMIAREFLREAGEYAVPQLLQVLLAKQDQALEAEVQMLLVSMGSQAVAPLSAALLEVDVATQEKLARILGQLGYDAAVPYLAELFQTTADDATRLAAERSIRSLGARTDRGLSSAAMYRELGERYYSEPRSLTSFPGEEHQLLWSYDPQFGLLPTAIRTEVFHEARVMSLAARALELDPNDQVAVALWIAANFSRQLDQPEDYDNPAYPADRWKEAMYYAVAAGPDTTQRVLARALRDRNTRLARLAIEALARSAGATALVGTDSRALVEALGYPEKRVRYESALAIARAQPRELFTGAEQVVPILASIISDASTNYAIVVASEIERQQILRASLEDMGYKVLPPVSDLGAAFRSIAEVASIDVIVTDLTSARTLDTISEARSTARLRATPILSLLPGAGVSRFAGEFADDPQTHLTRTGISSEQLQAGVERLVLESSGQPISEEEARAYSLSALQALRDIAIASVATGNQRQGVFDISDAAAPLHASLDDSTDDEINMKIAGVLSYIPLQDSQIALMDRATEAAGQQQIELLELVTDSAKRFGNLLQQRHIAWLIKTAELADDDMATVAAALMGALKLPSSEIVQMIRGEHG